MNQQPALYVPSRPAPDLSIPMPDVAADVDSLARVLWRRRWQIVMVFSAITCLGVVFLAAQTPRYTAHTIVVAASRQPDLATVDQVSAVTPPRPERDPDIESELQLMLSTSALGQIAEKLDLQRLPEFQDAAPSDSLAMLHRLWKDLVAGNWKNLLEPAGSAGTSESAKDGASMRSGGTEALVELMKKNLSVTQIGRSATVDIAFNASDATMAARVTNAIADSYIANRYKARLEDGQRASAYLNSRSAELQQELRAAEQAVEAFRKTNVLSDGRDIEQLRAEMVRTNDQLAGAKVAKVVAKSKLDEVESRVRAFGIVAALEPAEGAVTLDDRLRELAAQARGRLAAMGNRGSGYPDFQRAQQEASLYQNEVVAEAKARVQRLKSNVNIADQQVLMLEDRLQRTRTDYDNLSTAAITLRSLERQAAAARAVYEGFLARVKLTEQVGFNEAKSWIISAATPPSSPSSPKAMLILGATFMLAMGAAVSYALLTEHKYRQTILSSQDLAGRGFKTLGIVPDMGGRLGTLANVVAATERPSNTLFAESVSAIFTSVVELAGREESALVLLITSSLPFEGKSTTAIALAARMASAGKRVLMIDADLRAPQLNRAFGIATVQGLADVLDPSLDLDDAIHVDHDSRISVITAGSAHADPQNVLRSPKFAESLARWRAEYDFILIDSPPVLPISDARILVPLTDYCVFVTHWRKTRWNVALHALQLLRDSGAQLAGIVVSKVDVKKAASYGFGDSAAYGSAYRRYLTH
jgi:capsular exopolysaccharide synthesis family protein